MENHWNRNWTWSKKEKKKNLWEDIYHWITYSPHKLLPPPPHTPPLYKQKISLTPSLKLFSLGIKNFLTRRLENWGETLWISFWLPPKTWQRDFPIRAWVKMSTFNIYRLQMHFPVIWTQWIWKSSPTIVRYTCLTKNSTIVLGV